MADYNLGEARGKIVLETDFSSLKDAQSALDGYKKSAGDSATSQQEAWRKTGTAATVGGALVAAGFAVAVGAAGEFEFQMSAIQAVSGATSDEMDLIREAALRIGKDTSFSASEAAQAMEELSKAGISTTDILNGAADATVALAAAGGVDLPTAATIASNAMNQFGLKAEDLVNVTNKIAGASNASAIDMNQFAQSMGQVGAVANLAGLSFDDTTLAIAAMGNAGIVGSDAGTSLKTMLMNLQPATAEASALMKELGLVTEDGTNQFYTAEGSLKSMAEISDVLSTALAGMTDAQKQATLTTLFGTDAVRGAAIVADTGAAGFDKLAAAIDKTSAADVAATRMDNMKGSTEQLMGSIETVAITIGTLLIPALTDAIDQLTGAVNWFSNLDSGIQNTIISAVAITGAFLLFTGLLVKTVQGIQAVAAAYQALGIAQAIANAQTIISNTVWAAVRGYMLLASAATAVATAAQWALNAALTANPIGIIIVAIAALVAGLIWFFTQTELGQQIVQNVVNAMVTAWEWLAGVAQTVWTAVSDAFITAWNAVVGFFTGIWNAVAGFFAGIWNGIMDVIGAVVAWFNSYVMPGIQFVIDAIVGYFTMWYNIVSFVIGAIMSVVAPLVQWFMTYVAPLIQAFVNLIAALFNFMWQTIVWIWQSIVDAVVNFVTLLVDGVVFLFNLWLTTVITVLTAIWDFIVMVWTAIVDAVSGFIQGIVDFVVFWFNVWLTTVQSVMAAVWAVISDIWNNIVNFLRPIIQGIVDFISSVWGTISGIVSGIFNAVWGFISSIWNNIFSFISDIVNRVVSTITSVWNSIVGTVSGIFLNVYNAIKDPIQNALDFIMGFKDKVLGFFAGAGQWLLQAGKNIIDGLIKGIENALGGLTDILNGITSMIPKEKGPPAKDKVLLTPAGKLIMQSLMSGMQSEYGNLVGMLGGITSAIPASLNADILTNVNGGKGARPIEINVEWHAADNDDVSTREQVMEMLGHASELVREELT